ncbi:hypothetical protein HGO38_30705 [Rhizobium sp. CG5]|uniref:hypothetical protein n=1 Tax=Rhizobium sp. CG5 TaxID=2726076 RepID=UPI002033896D|nr:hypothetical protein [Rhizobium sp. CG5]MCM2477820.1 hypothetical protein [Rhizobium sp. CG5]
MKTDSLHKGPAYSPALIGFALIAGLLLTSSIWQQVTTARFATLMLLAKKIELGQPVSRDAIPTYIQQVPDIVEAGTCRSDVVRAGLTVVLADLDRQNSTDDYDAWAAAMERSQNYLRHALSCLPADGNLWLRLAMVRFAVAAEPRELASLMSQSVNLAPVEPNIVAGRFVMWNKMNAATLQEASRSVESDLRLLLSQAPPLRKSILAAPSPSLLPYVEKAAGPVRP